MWTTDETPYWMPSRKAWSSLKRKRKIQGWERKHREDVKRSGVKDSRTRQENKRIRKNKYRKDW